MKINEKLTFYEFFAGGGMARAGLGDNWDCLFANDFDIKKAETYRKNWGGDELIVSDVGTLSIDDIPGKADLAWASFPCQDLSLAGNRSGLHAQRSGSFWPFWNLMKALSRQQRAPKIIVLENVCGALTSHNGADFEAIVDAICKLGYRVGAMTINADKFLPQSRARLFIVAVRNDLEFDNISSLIPNPIWHSKSLVVAVQSLPEELLKNWIWWSIPDPPRREKNFIDLIEDEPVGVQWKSSEEVERILDMMSPKNLQKVKDAKLVKKKMVGGVYRRTRNGVQRAEVRFDDVAGCLRTPTGGSSRQLILIVEGEKIASRLLSAREAARLMGLKESYILPTNYNNAYHLAGDGVAVPVVAYLESALLRPILQNEGISKKKVA